MPTLYNKTLQTLLHSNERNNMILCLHLVDDVSALLHYCWLFNGRSLPKDFGLPLREMDGVLELAILVFSEFPVIFGKADSTWRDKDKLEYLSDYCKKHKNIHNAHTIQ